MPITPYVRPQETITQILRQTATTVATRRNPLVIGPQFKLFLNDGRELSKKTFSTASNTLGYEVSENGTVSTIDTSLYKPYLPSVRLYGEGLLAKTNGTSLTLSGRVTGDSAVARLATGTLAGGASAGGTRDTNLNGRAVKVGDTLKLTANSQTVYRKVTALLPFVGPSQTYVGTTLTTLTTALTVTGAVKSVTGLSPETTVAGLLAIKGPYTGSNDRRYFVEVTAIGATGSLKIYDASGQVSVTTITFNTTAAVIAANAVSIGDGISIGSSAVLTGVVVGQKFYFDVLAAKASTSDFNGVRVDGPMPGTTGDITTDVYQEFTGEISAANLVTATPTISESGVVYAAALGLTSAATGSNANSPFENNVGKVFVSYKALVLPRATESAFAVSSASEIQSLLGDLTYDNDLGRGVAEAFKGNQGRKVYVLRTAGVTAADFAAALTKVRTSDVYYALAVMTEDEAVMKLVVAHCEEMSNKYNRNFRRCYVGTDSPGAYLKWGALSSGSLRQGTLSNNIFAIDAASQIGGTFRATAAIGDTITISGGGSYLIKEIVGDYEVLLDISTSTSFVSSGFTLTAKDSAENAAKFVQARSQAISSRRCTNVWTDAAVYDGRVVPMRFVAAEIAGIRCALLPQQGLTMTEITSVTSAPSMYTRFSPELLDQIASNGVLVVTQESEGGEVFVRHQLTTETEDGALAYEDSVGVVVDEFSYSEKDLFRGYIGKKNATRDTIEDMRVRLKQLALDSTQTNFNTRDIGPMVIRFFDIDGNENEVTVRISGQLADRIETYVRLRVPLPINGIDNYIDVETSILL